MHTLRGVLTACGPRAAATVTACTGEVLALKSARNPFRKREKELWALWGQQHAAVQDAETALSAAEEQVSAASIQTTFMLHMVACTAQL
jgi:hypothetical protein